jgi:hypothetical protein
MEPAQLLTDFGDKYLTSIRWQGHDGMEIVSESAG